MEEIIRTLKEQLKEVTGLEFSSDQVRRATDGTLGMLELEKDIEAQVLIWSAEETYRELVAVGIPADDVLHAALAHCYYHALQRGRMEGMLGGTGGVEGPERTVNDSP